MGNFFKNFGKGILYLLVLPFTLVILSIYAVVGLFAFLFMGIKSIVLFFTGRSLYDDLPEDKKAKEIIASLSAPKAEATLAAQTNASEVAIEKPQNGAQNPSIYMQPEEVDEDPFYIPQYLKNTPEVENKEDEEEKEEVDEDLVDENDISYIPRDDEEEKPSFDDDSDNFNI